MPIAFMAERSLRCDHRQKLSVGIIGDFAVAQETGVAAQSQNTSCDIDNIFHSIQR